MFTVDPPRPSGIRTATHPRWIAVLALSATGAASPAAAQERQVVSNRVTVSDSDASLSLEFNSGPGFEVSFQNGEIRVDGERVGSYQAGGELEASWRSLLSDVVPLDDGPLADALLAWEPGGQLSGESRAAALRLDRALEDVLAGPEPGAAVSAPQAPGGASAGGVADVLVPPLLRLLLQRGQVLEEALRDVDLTRLTVHIGEDVTVEDGGDIDGALLVVDGDATISGEVPGDVVVVGGALRIEADALIRGEVRVIDGRLERAGGTVEGSILTVDAGNRAEAETEAVEQAVDEPVSARPARQAESAGRRFGHVASGLGGLFGDAFWLAVLLAVGVAVVHFAGDRLHNIAEVARAAPGRAALVGLAGGFLLLPVWVLGIVALAVSIIGIPLLIAWLPLFPLAALLAHGLGYLAVASIVGEWLARRGIPALDRFRPSNQLHVLAVGLAALVVPSALAHVTEMGGPSLGSFLSGLFTLVAVATAMLALMFGFGAVLLSGVGRTSDPGGMAAAYGGGIRATRAWTRRRARRGAPNGPQRDHEAPGHAPEREHPEDGGGGD